MEDDRADDRAPAGVAGDRSDARRVLFIAGTAHGIGAAVAEDASRRGHALVLGDIDEPALRAQAEGLAARGPVLARRLDVTSGDEVRAWVRAGLDAFGRMDAMIANAGGVVSLVKSGRLGTNIQPFAENDPGDWRPIVELNLLGTFNLAHAAIAPMREAGRGRIVLVSSAAGVSGGAGLAVYSAAKGGVIAFTKALARELGRTGITVNSVAPGGIATRAFPAGAASSAARMERIPAGRMGTPEEVANAILYFACDAPGYITGETLAVSGGPP